MPVEPYTCVNNVLKALSFGLIPSPGNLHRPLSLRLHRHISARLHALLHAVADT